MINLGFRASTREHTPLLAAGLTSLLSLLGCASEPASVEDDSPASLAVNAVDAGKAKDAGTTDPKDLEGDGFTGPWSNGEVKGGTIALQTPDKHFVAEVRANGTGCPLGSSKVSISNDGRFFIIDFSSYKLHVTPRAKVEVQDCVLSTKVTTPEKYQFAVSKFRYQGDVDLDTGVQLRIKARYWFQGDASEVGNTERENNMTGPLDQNFQFSYTPDPETLVWSPCGVERDLNVQTVLRLLNGSPAKTGYASLAKVTTGSQPSPDFSLAFGFVWRKCE